jgi:hypothetical protein
VSRVALLLFACAVPLLMAGASGGDAEDRATGVIGLALAAMAVLALATGAP